MEGALSLLSRKESVAENWQRLLFVLYSVTYFFDGITRYKHAIHIAILITAVTIIWKDKALLKTMFSRDKIFLPLLVLVYGLYSTFISIDTHLSLKYFNQHILLTNFLLPLMVSVLLLNLSVQQVARTWLQSLIVLFIVLTISEAYTYIREYRDGVLPFTNFDHRFITDALIFSLPALLWLTLNKRPASLACLVIAAAIYIFLTLGTLQRGTWVSIFALFLLWCFFMRRWKFCSLVLGAGVCFLVVLSLFSTKQTELVNHKLHQTDSSQRFGSGTQGAGLDMILENPVIGYGLGDKVYLKAYAQNLDSHPDWFFREPISPHNIYLSFWFSAGIPGLIALILFFAVLFRTSFIHWKNTTNETQHAWLSIMLIAGSAYLVRGIVELSDFDSTSLLIALVIGLTAPRPQTADA